MVSARFGRGFDEVLAKPRSSEPGSTKPENEFAGKKIQGEAPKICVRVRRLIMNE